METLIMRFFQGSFIGGLSGIPARREKIIRPLLDCTRDDVLAFLRAGKMKYCVDRSNLEQKFLRNRIRRDLLPVIGRIFPGYRKSLSVLRDKFGILSAFIDDEIERKSTWREVHTDRAWGYKTLAQPFLDLPPIMRLQMLYRLADAILRKDCRGTLRIPYVFFSPVLDGDWFFPRRILIRGHGLKLFWKGESLFLMRDVVGSSKKGYLIEVKDRDTIEIADTGLVVSVSTGRNGEESDFRYSSKAVRGPLLVRSRRPGDTIPISTGKKSLKKLFNEWKVPEEQRWLVPLVIDRRGVLAVMGKSLGFPNRFSVKLQKKTNTDDSSMTINYNRGVPSTGKYR
jgi:tRNA(Ile)-lysidine synthase